MSRLLKLEELGMLLLGLFLFAQLDFSWWLFALLFLAPDLGMFGYIVGNRTGATCYNFFHHKGIAIAFYLTGTFLHLPWLQLAGIIFFSHASFDRVLGYGLKLSKGFKFTHLGEIGKAGLKSQQPKRYG